MNRDLRHPISNHEIRAFEEDGVVCLRDQFDQEWVARMRQACLASISTEEIPVTKFRSPAGTGRMVTASHMSRKNTVFMDYAINSPAAEISARLMGLNEVRYFYDQIFIKDPGTETPTDWHHDLPFWPFDGNHIASVWLALTPVTRADSGLVYVAGSHKWGKLYRPGPAVPNTDFVGPEAQAYEACPEFHREFDNPDYRFLDWDMAPGDALVHHPLTVHGSGRNASPTEARIALSCRYFGGDVTWHGHRTQSYVPGTEAENRFQRGEMPRDDDLFPVVWRR